ncbi:hypothetical protein ABJI51_37770 [Amycolatopsis sp. NEAU-NG30]|uniref:Uncharacterized protein n=1 Tax=Amycolatopsis melonis TaxID=3156488 RepID=A0ABV0LRE7_9PSEU
MAEFRYKITKYDPRFYSGPGGAYTRDEWTSFSDIGKTFDGVELTREAYERIEGLYLMAVRTGLEAAGIEQLRVRGLEDHGDAPDSLTEGKPVALPEAVEICRALLREAGFWCRLEDGDRAYVHVGYDYYLYLGTPVDVGPALAPIVEAGLFVEAGFTSPYIE